MVLIMELHLALRTMQNFPHSLVQVPLGQLLLRDEPISGIEVDLREKQHKPISHIELVLIIEEIIGVVELLPLGFMMLLMMLMMMLQMMFMMLLLMMLLLMMLMMLLLMMLLMMFMMLLLMMFMMIIKMVVVGVFFLMVMVMMACNFGEFFVVFIEVHSLPLLVLLVTLHLSHHGIKRHRVMVVVMAEVMVGIVVLKVVLCSESEVGLDLQPPMAMAAGGVGMVVIVGVLW